MKAVGIKEVNTGLCDTLGLRVVVDGVEYSGYLIKNG